MTAPAFSRPGTSPARRRPRTLLRLVLLASLALAPASPAAPPAMFSRVSDEMMEVTEFFETVLPGTLKKYNLVLDFKPKFGDVRNREFIRYPLELRYGATERLEIIGGITPYSPSPFNTGREHRWGIGEVRLGARFDTKDGFWFYDRATFGLETRVPTGNPPVDLIDGYTHVRPLLTASRRLHYPHTTLFTALSYDRALDTPGRHDPTSERVIRQNITQVAPGLLYKPGQYGWFAQYEFRHLEEEIGYRLSHEGRLGMIWDMPQSRSRAWKLPGKWQIELAAKVLKEEGRGLDPGVVTRIRVRTTLREVFSDPKRKQAP